MAFTAVLLTLAGTAQATPKVTQQTKTYNIAATSIAGLASEMKAKGPRGYWAYTAWTVRWSGDCRLSVHVDYIFPRHTRPNAMPADVRRKYDAMLKALTAHEQQHGKHGVMAAQEIEKAGCKGGDAIIRKYNAIDVDFDKRTNHGINQGATLR
jgi:predicted secreted Zn-dependent protease